MAARGRRQRDEEWSRKFSNLLGLVVESNGITLNHLDSEAGILMGTVKILSQIDRGGLGPALL